MSENNQTKSKESNGRGGKRQNAGRKAGSATKRTREIADKAMEEGITPLEFMLEIMRTEPSDDVKDPRLLADLLGMRFEAAKAAAPYIHPRLAAVEHSGGVTIRTLAEELAELNAQRDAEDSSSVA
jgi:hypothetical protein